MGYGLAIVTDSFIRPVNWAEDLKWAEKKFPFTYSADSGGFVAVSKGERVGIAVIGHVTYSSAVIEGYLTYKAVKLGLIEFTRDYLFGELKRSVVYCQTAANNFKCIRFVTKLGGVEYHRIPNGWDEGIDLIQYLINRDAVTRWGDKHELF